MAFFAKGIVDGLKKAILQPSTAGMSSAGVGIITLEKIS